MLAGTLIGAGQPAAQRCRAGPLLLRAGREQGHAGQVVDDLLHGLLGRPPPHVEVGASGRGVGFRPPGHDPGAGGQAGEERGVQPPPAGGLQPAAHSHAGGDDEVVGRLLGNNLAVNTDKSAPMMAMADPMVFGTARPPRRMSWPAIVALTLISGVYYFRRMEHSFADVA